MPPVYMPEDRQAFSRAFFTLKEFVMSKYFLVCLVAAAALVSGGAMADVNLKGKTTLSVKVKGAVTNMALGPNATAHQNLSSIVGNVTAGGDVSLSTDVTGAVTNMALGPNAKAKQNLASITSGT
jgi:hypothetical protein